MNETELIKKYFFPLSKTSNHLLTYKMMSILQNFKKENFIISVDNFIQGIHCPSF